MTSLTLMRNDREYFIEFEVKDSDGDVVDITGSNIYFKLQKYGSSTLTMNKLCSIVNGTAGICRIYIYDELVDESGDFHAELEVQWSSGKKLTAPSISIQVLKDLPR